MLMASRLGKMVVRLAAAAFSLALAAAAASPPLLVTSADISVAIDAASGTIIQLNTSAGFTTAVTAGFAAGELNGVPPMPTNTSVAACGTSVCVSRSVLVTGQLSNGSCCTTYQVDVNEVFAPVAPAIPGAAPSHIAWTVTIASSAAAAWRTTFNTSVTLAVTGANASDALYWVPRHGPTATPTIWDDVLRMLSAADSPTPRRTQYGHAMMFDDLDGREESAATLGVIVSRSAGGGVAVVQDPSDPLFGVTMNADPATISIARWYNRLGAASQPVSFTTALVPVTGLDWRPAFAWARIALPQFFLAPTLLSAAAHTPSVGADDQMDAAHGLNAPRCLPRFPCRHQPHCAVATATPPHRGPRCLHVRRRRRPQRDSSGQLRRHAQLGRALLVAVHRHAAAAAGGARVGIQHR